MTWEKLKRIFRRRGDIPSLAPDFKWVDAADNPWGVQVLDVRPYTLSMLSVAEARGETEIIALLSEYDSSAS